MDTKNNPVDVDFMFKERNFLCFIFWLNAGIE